MPVTATRRVEAGQPAAALRYTESYGAFSVAVPEEWELREYPGLKYKILIGTRDRGYTPNINFVTESNSTTLGLYVEQNTVALENTLNDFEVVANDAITTESGIRGRRLVTFSTQSGVDVRQTFYFFSLPNGEKVIITCSAAAAGGERYDYIFRECALSLEAKAS